MGRLLSRRFRHNLDQLAALRCAAQAHGRSGEVQLQTDEPATSLPVPDFIDRRVRKRIQRQKTHQEGRILCDLCGRKLIFAPDLLPPHPGMPDEARASRKDTRRIGSLLWQHGLDRERVPHQWQKSQADRWTEGIRLQGGTHRLKPNAYDDQPASSVLLLGALAPGRNQRREGSKMPEEENPIG